MLLGKKPENVTKAERQIAKAVNFGLLYGQGSRGLKEYAQNTYGVSMTFAEADRHRDGWFKAYPAFKAWHRATDACISQGRPIRTPAGRTRAGKPKLTEALNMPVQGGAAEAMIVALGRFTRRRDEAGIDATLIATVHDELLVETTPEAAQEAKRLLEKSMIEGMLAVFPNASTNGLVEANVCKSWADK
jgi:DNA polymerase-1